MASDGVKDGRIAEGLGMKGLSVEQFNMVCCLLYALSKHLINAHLWPLVLPLHSLKSGGLS